MDTEQGREIVVSTDSGTYYTGIPVEPWSDNPAEARVYPDPRQAWEDARKLQGQFKDTLEDTHLSLHLRNPDDPQDTRRAVSLAAEDNRPALRTAWANEFGEPLPVDMPRAPVDAAQTLRHMAEYLKDVDWDVVPRTDPGLALDPSFREAAARIATTDPDAVSAMWKENAPSTIPLPDLNLDVTERYAAAPQAAPANTTEATATTAVEPTVIVSPQPAQPDPAAEAFRTASANAGHAAPEVLPEASEPAPRAAPAGAGRADALGEVDTYLAGVDWAAIREQHHGAPETRGDIGLDAKFWATAARLSLSESGKEAVEAIWARHAPEDFPAPFQDPAAKRPAPAPEENEVSQGGRPAPAAPPTEAPDTTLMDAQDVKLRAAAARARDPAQAPPPAGESNEIQRGPRDPLDRAIEGAINDLKTPRETADAPTAAAAPGPTQDAALPTYVRRHFVHTGNDFYYRNDPAKLAFQAKGDAFKAKDPSVGVATALVEMAQSKGWGSIKVKGTDEFKQRVYEAAMERGLKVEGYTPTPGEKAAIDERKAQGPTATSPRPEPGAPTAERPAEAIPDAPESRMRGVLVSHGPQLDRWENPETNPDGSPIYTVVLRTPSGALQQHSGADLKRALTDSGAKVGDTIELAGVGKRPLVVSTSRYVPGEDGKASKEQGTKTVEVDAWTVSVRQPQSQESDQRPAAPARTTPRGGGFRGVLESHGAAPYQDKPDGSKSYYVRLRDPEGQVHTHWGVDLRRAVEESGVKPGDAVQVAREGRKPVTVKIREVDAAGKATYPEKTVQREVWSVRPQERDPAAEAVRSFVDRSMPNLDPAGRERIMEKVKEHRGPEAGPAPKAPPVGTNEVKKGRAPERAADSRSR